jgi:hypothetical protein
MLDSIQRQWQKTNMIAADMLWKVIADERRWTIRVYGVWGTLRTTAVTREVLDNSLRQAMTWAGRVTVRS